MKPLSKKHRYISISLLFLAFIIFAPIIVLYSFGYRLDSGFTLQKTGGVFIHANIPNAAVFIEDEYYKNNGLFLRNILIQDLVPNRSYAIRMQKEGYQSWVKDIFVYPSIVSEGRVLMLPEQYEVREILPYIDIDGNATSTPPRVDAKPNNSEYNLIFELFEPPLIATTTKQIVEEEILMTATSPKSKSKIELFFEGLEIEDYQDLENLIVEGKEVSWLDRGNILLHWIDENSTTPFYYCGGPDRECKTNMILDWVQPILRFDYFPGRFDVWVVLVKDGIFAVEIDDRSERNIQTIYLGYDLDYRLSSGGRLLIRDDSSFLEINL